MPTYEYECAKCKKRFDVFQSITAKPLSKHEGCGGKVKRIISGGAGLIFKGTGFYITDYKKKPSGSAGSQSSPSSSEKKNDSKSSSGADTKKD